jgi:hypothetical protein
MPSAFFDKPLCNFVMKLYYHYCFHVEHYFKYTFSPAVGYYAHC